MFNLSDLSNDPHPVYSNLNHDAVAQGSTILGLIVIGVVLFLFIRLYIRQLWIQFVVALAVAAAIFFTIKHIHSVMEMIQTLRSIIVEA